MDVEYECLGNDDVSSVRLFVTIILFLAHMQACPWTTCIEVTDQLFSVSHLLGSCLEGMLLRQGLPMSLAPFYCTRWECHWTTHLVFARNPVPSCPLTEATDL